MDLKEEAGLGEAINRHWYYTSKAKMAAAHIGRCRSVLDIGAGSGFFSRWLLRNKFAERAACIDTGYPNEWDDREAGREIVFRRSIVSSDADLVLMMDVLEHVDDDVKLLRECLDMVQPGARVLITVPAFQFLWSAHDEFLEHRRRYTLPQLRGTVEKAGAHVTSGHYYYGAIFPLAAGVRLFQRRRKPDSSDMRQTNPALNTALEAICKAEIAIMRWNKVAGLSVVMTCRK